MIFALPIMSGCSDVCSNTVVARSDAPDGQHSAVTSSAIAAQQPAILSGIQQLIGSGNAFRADDDHGAASAGERGGPWAEIQWLSPDHLLVRYTGESRIFEQKHEVSGVSISYEAVAR